MVGAPGAPDILTLVAFAYQVYDTYKGAPQRCKALREDISGLKMVLKRLGDRMESKQQQDDKGNLTSDDSADLEELIRQAGQLLGELQAKQGLTHAPQGLTRFKWSQREIDSFRSRITSLCGIIAAFYSSMQVKTPDLGSTISLDQQRILDKLDSLLAKIHDENAPPYTAAVARNESAISAPVEDNMWRELVGEMRNYGISEKEADQHRSTILKSAAEAAAAGLEARRSPGLSIAAGSQHASGDVEILSAVYGPSIVTDRVQNIFRSHARRKVTNISFTATNDTFGNDPFPGNAKAFSMVWRKARHLDYGTLYSAAQKVFAEEGQTIRIDLKAQLPDHESSDEAPGSIHVVTASWHNQDVTEKVAAIARTSRQPTIVASNYEFGRDPRVGSVKTLSVTWAYSDTAASLSYCEVKSVRENASLEIPPFLEVLCANWGGLDITSVLQAKIGLNQTIQLDSNTLPLIASPDPWPSHRKTISILYQYASDPMQILVVGEGQSSVTIQPDSPFRRNFFFTSKFGPAADITALAAVWGLQPVPEAPFRQAVMDNEPIPCQNHFFGRDGWGGEEKTCQVFLQNNSTGETTCIVGREGTELALPIVWPGEDEMEMYGSS